MENVKTLIDEICKVKGMILSKALYDDNLSDEAMDMIRALDILMDTSCKVMYDQAKQLNDINTKLDKLLAK